MSRGSAGKNEAKLRFDVALTMLCVNDPDFPNACGSAAKNNLRIKHYSLSHTHPKANTDEKVAHSAILTF